MSDSPRTTITIPPERIADPASLLIDARFLVDSARGLLDRAAALHPALPAALSSMRFSLGGIGLELEHVAEVLARDCGAGGCQLHHPGAPVCARVKCSGSNHAASCPVFQAQHPELADPCPYTGCHLPYSTHHHFSPGPGEPFEIRPGQPIPRERKRCHADGCTATATHGPMPGQPVACWSHAGEWGIA